MGQTTKRFYKSSRVKSNAFTLIECMISLLLIAIVLAGGIAYYFYSNDYLQAAIRKRIATEIASSKLEEIKNKGYYIEWPHEQDLSSDTLFLEGVKAPSVTHTGR